MPEACLLAIGNEIVSGKISDTNSAHIASTLSELGIIVRRVSSVRDVKEEIVAELNYDLSLAPLVITTGGLGPTSDDLTRYAVAECCGTELRENETSLDRLRSYIEKRGRSLSENNLSQAMFPEYSLVLENPIGTADAFITPLTSKVSGFEKSHIVSLPGVPSEMKRILGDRVSTWLTEAYDDLLPWNEIHLKCFGLSEADVGARIDALEITDKVDIAYRPSFPELLVSLRDTERLDQERLIAVRDSVIDALGRQFVYSLELDMSIPKVIAGLLLEQKQTLALAESCTGGLISHMLVSLPGSSAFFRGAAVSYSNDAKQIYCNVKPALIEHFGAVSEEVACSMANGARDSLGADYGLSVTGIAGPGGETDEKPVGSIWIGLAFPGGVQAFHFNFPWERNALRKYTSTLALDLLRRKLSNLPLSNE
jgi:nicotinamide-nucleotide amidase